jgi:hypothetical protein
MLRPANLPNCEDFKAALLLIKDNLSKKERSMLTFLYYANERTMTSSKMATALGDSGQANIAFGKLGRKLSDALNFKPGKRKNNTYQWWNILALGPKNINIKPYKWTMHPELADALLAVGLVKRHKT